jgi:hypothetical protein
MSVCRFCAANRLKTDIGYFENSKLTFISGQFWNFPTSGSGAISGFFKTSKINHILMSDYQVKISGNSDHHALQNLSLNTDARK